jgi:hypothetical protein
MWRAPRRDPSTTVGHDADGLEIDAVAAALTAAASAGAVAVATAPTELPIAS